MRTVLSFPLAVWGLLTLALASRAWRSSSYTRWRWETAFGLGAPESRAERIRGALAFGVWVARMRRRG